MEPFNDLHSWSKQYREDARREAGERHLHKQERANGQPISVRRMKRYVAALLVVLGVVGLVGALAVGTGFAKDENDAGAMCSKATVHGTYLFAQDGVDVTGKEQAPFAIAGMEKYDGNGKVKTVISANFNGDVVRHESVSGTYTVKADCTGTVTYRQGEVLDVFIAPNGSMFTFVQIKPSDAVTSGFELQGTAKRVAQ